MVEEKHFVNSLLAVANEIKKLNETREFRKIFENEMSNAKNFEKMMVDDESNENDKSGIDKDMCLRMEVFDDKDYDIEEVKYWNFTSKNKTQKSNIIRTVVYKYPESSYVIKKVPILIESSKESKENEKNDESSIAQSSTASDTSNINKMSEKLIVDNKTTNEAAKDSLKIKSDTSKFSPIKLQTNISTASLKIPSTSSESIIKDKTNQKLDQEANDIKPSRQRSSNSTSSGSSATSTNNLTKPTKYKAAISTNVKSEIKVTVAPANTINSASITTSLKPKPKLLQSITSSTRSSLNNNVANTKMETSVNKFTAEDIILIDEDDDIIRDFDDDDEELAKSQKSETSTSKSNDSSNKIMKTEQKVERSSIIELQDANKKSNKRMSSSRYESLKDLSSEDESDTTYKHSFTKKKTSASAIQPSNKTNQQRKSDKPKIDEPIPKPVAELRQTRRLSRTKLQDLGADDAKDIRTDDKQSKNLTGKKQIISNKQLNELSSSSSSSISSSMSNKEKAGDRLRVTRSKSKLIDSK